MVNTMEQVVDRVADKLAKALYHKNLHELVRYPYTYCYDMFRTKTTRFSSSSRADVARIMDDISIDDYECKIVAILGMIDAVSVEYMFNAVDSDLYLELKNIVNMAFNILKKYENNDSYFTEN